MVKHPETPPPLRGRSVRSANRKGGAARSIPAQAIGLPLPLAGEGGGISKLEVPMAEQKCPAWKISSRLRANARALRRSSTDAERILWSELRDHRLTHAGF